MRSIYSTAFPRPGAKTGTWLLRFVSRTKRICSPELPPLPNIAKERVYICSIALIFFVTTLVQARTCATRLAELERFCLWLSCFCCLVALERRERWDVSNPAQYLRLAGVILDVVAPRDVFSPAQNLAPQRTSCPSQRRESVNMCPWQLLQNRIFFRLHAPVCVIGKVVRCRRNYDVGDSARQAHSTGLGAGSSERLVSELYPWDYHADTTELMP